MIAVPSVGRHRYHADPAAAGQGAEAAARPPPAGRGPPPRAAGPRQRHRQEPAATSRRWSDL